MVTLEAILTEAQSDPSSQNSTILDADHFCTIRGPSSPIFRARLEAALASSGDLTRAQQLNAAEGLEVIEPVKAGIHGGYWYLRNLTHRDEIYPAGERQYRSIVEALLAAIEWWEAEAWCRGVMVRTFDINHPNRPADSPSG